MMKLIDVLLVLLLPSLILLHLLIAPYTKVEESFNIQAIHDIIEWSPYSPLSKQRFDHFSFPGAVPRTFVGASFLALLSKPVLYLTSLQHAIHYPQLIVRGILGLFNAGALLWYRNGLIKAFGKDVARWWVLLLGSQFHVIFYASRTLPNMFAFFVTTLAFRECLPVTRTANKALTEKRQKNMIYLFVAAGVIFRSEIALLLGTQLLDSLLHSRISLRTTIITGVKAALVALAISVPIDSYFWRRPIWPELAGFYFNAIQGKSADWGTSPYGYYFLNLLPRLLLNPVILMPLIPLSTLLSPTSYPSARLVIPSILFIAIYSLQPHKESRFIIYVVPPLTAAASLSASYIWTRRSKSIIYLFASILLSGSILASFAASTAMLLISSLNYPGGDALSQLHIYMRSHADLSTSADFEDANRVHIHMDVLSCMTGITQFQHYYRTPDQTINEHMKNPHLPYIGGRQTRVFYDKTEDTEILLDPSFWERFHYALMEEPGKAIGAWDVIGTVYAYAGMEILRPGDEVGSDEEDLETVYAANNLTKMKDGEEVNLYSEDVIGAVGEGAQLHSEKERSQLGDVRLWGLSPFGIYTTARDSVRLATGGWWVGPKMEPKIRILRNRKRPRFG